MSSRQLTKRELQLRKQAARMQEKSLPDQVRRAYGEAAPDAAEPASDEQPASEARDKARASLIARGFLSEEELTTLSVDAATTLVLERLHEQVSALESEGDDGGGEDSNTASFKKPPRILRR